MKFSLPKTRQVSAKKSPAKDQTAPSMPRIGRNRFKARNFLESLGFAMAGLHYIYRTQRNFRIDLYCAGVVLCVGFMFGLTPAEWAPLLIVMGWVLFAEALNTAVEYTVDLYTQGEFDMRAKVIKDISAGACLLSAVFAVIVGCWIFIPHVWAWVVSGI